MLVFEDFDAFLRTFRRLNGESSDDDPRFGSSSGAELLEAFEKALGHSSLRATRLGQSDEEFRDAFPSNFALQALLNPHSELKIGDAILIVKDHETIRINDGDRRTLALVRSGAIPSSDNVERIVLQDELEAHNESLSEEASFHNCTCSRFSLCSTETLYDGGLARFKSKIYVETVPITPISILTIVGGTTKSDRRDDCESRWKDNDIDQIEVVSSARVMTNSCELHESVGVTEVETNSDKASWSRSYFSAFGRRVDAESHPVQLNFHSRHEIRDGSFFCARDLDLCPCDDANLVCGAAPCEPPPSGIGRRGDITPALWYLLRD